MTGRMIDYLILGLSNVLRYKLRSALTMLGIVLGIAGLLSMLAVGEGAKQEILRKMEGMGLHNIIVTSRRPQVTAQKDQGGGQQEFVFSYGLTFKDLARCRTSIPGLVRALPVHEIRDDVTLGRIANAKVLGVTTDYFRTFPVKVLVGRGLSDFDAARRLRTCVLVAPLPRQLVGFGNPLDVRLTIGVNVFTVVGVVRPRAELDADAEDAAVAPASSNLLRVFIPYETAISRFGTTSRVRGQGSFQAFKIELDQIILECEDPLLAVKPLVAILEHGHDDVDYEITVPVELLRQRQHAQRTFNIVLLVVASLILLVGGVGIMNIMLVSVTERTKEIGIRRAVGARRRDIIWQFLVETIALTLSGGVLGCLIGLGGVFVIAISTGWPVSITPLALVACLLLSIAAGLAFGLYPARKAASINPVVALRHE